MIVWFKATCTKCGHKGWWGSASDQIPATEHPARESFQKLGWIFPSLEDVLCPSCAIKVQCNVG